MRADDAVLVSGASFAGLATAYWMNALGYRVTVIEAARSLKKGGTPVDIEGQAIDVLTRMGMMEAVRAKALPPRDLVFKNADDSTIGTMAAGGDPDDEKYEIHRDDLLDILFASVGTSADVMFGRSIKQLENGARGVSVTFDDDSRHGYALVLGCDGNRSNTRRLAFPAGEDGSFFMGGYFFLKVVPELGIVPANESQIFSLPGRTVLLNGYDDRTDIALAFRTERPLDYDYRDRATQRRMVHEHFDGLRWKVPALLQHVDAGDDFYFDRINQIRLPAWSQGRVALVGDAAYCVSPVAGMGGSMALIGAACLADSLQQHDGDHDLAFAKYRDKLYPLVEEVQARAVTQGMPIMFPPDDAAIAERNRRIIDGKLDV